MGHYPNPPDSFPKPGSESFMDEFGRYIMALVHGLHAEHTATQTENNLAVIIAAPVNIAVPSPGFAHLIIGNGENIHRCIVDSVFEMCSARMQRANEPMTEKQFMKTCVELMSEVAAHACSQFIQLHNNTAKVRIMHDESRLHGEDSQINP